MYLQIFKFKRIRHFFMIFNLMLTTVIILAGCNKSVAVETNDSESNTDYSDTNLRETDSNSGSDSDSSSYIELDVGLNFVCAITSEHKLNCFGDNASVVDNTPSGSFSLLSAGKNHVCGLTLNKKIICWGDNSDGQCSPPEGLYSGVSAGGRHSCGITANTAVCWGANDAGQLSSPDSLLVELQSHEDCTCGLLSDNSLKCWGSAQYDDCINQDGPVTSFNFGSYREEGKVEFEGGEHRYLCSSNGEQVLCPNYQIDSINFSENVSTVIGGSVILYGLLESGILEAGGSGYRLKPEEEKIINQQNAAGGFLKAASAYGMTCGITIDSKLICWQDLYYLPGPPLD